MVLLSIEFIILFLYYYNYLLINHNGRKRLDIERYRQYKRDSSPKYFSTSKSCSNISSIIVKSDSRKLYIGTQISCRYASFVVYYEGYSTKRYNTREFFNFSSQYLPKRDSNGKKTNSIARIRVGTYRTLLLYRALHSTYVAAITKKKFPQILSFIRVYRLQRCFRENNVREDVLNNKKGDFFLHPF